MAHSDRLFGPLYVLASASVLVLAVLLSGCATTTAQTVDIKAVCIPLKTYTQAQQDAIAAALPTAAPALQGAITDYETLRDADRACLGTSAAPQALPSK